MNQLKNDAISELSEHIKSNTKRVSLKNTAGSSVAVAAALTVTNGIHLFLLSDREEAAYFYNDLVYLLDEESGQLERNRVHSGDHL